MVMEKDKVKSHSYYSDEHDVLAIFIGVVLIILVSAILFFNINNVLATDAGPLFPLTVINDASDCDLPCVDWISPESVNLSDNF